MRTVWAHIAVGLIIGQAAAQHIPSAKEVHIAVQVRDQSGDPIGDLKPRDFTVSAAGNTLPLGVGSPIPRKSNIPPEIPTRLLIVLITRDPTIRLSLPKKLDLAWRAGWQVGVEEIRAETQFVSSPAQLQAELNRPAVAHRSLATAVRDLAHFPGRRIVFLVTDKGTNISQAALGSILLGGATVYHAGGDPAKQLIPYGFSWGYSPIINHPMGPLEVESTFSGGGAQYERQRGRETEDNNLRSAMQDALEDAKGYYDLKVQIPTDLNSLSLKLNVWGNTGSKCYIFAEPYAEGAKPPSLTIIDSSPARIH